MKLKLWNWVVSILPGLFFSFTCYLLLEPWAGLFFRWNYGQFNFNQKLVMLLLILEGIMLGVWLENVRNEKYRYYLLAGVLIIDSIFIYLLGWPLKFFIPLTIVLLLLGLRFITYNTSIEFNQDFLRGILLIIFMVAFERSGFNFNYRNVIMFFFLGISLSIYFNQLKMRNKNSETNKSFLMAALGLGLLQIIISTAVMIPLNRSIFQGVLRFTGKVYDYFIDLLLLILKPLLWLLTPVINLLIKFWESGSGQRPRNRGELPGYAQQIIIDVKKIAPDKDFRYLISYVLTFLFLLFLIYFIRNYVKRGRKEERGFIESRESVFSYQELINYFKATWQNVKNRLFKPKCQPNQYHGSSPIIIIRKIYYLFLINAAELLPLKRFHTPNEYADVLQKKGYYKEWKKELEQLTLLYNQARYGKQASKQDVLKAQDIMSLLSEGKQKEN